MGKGSKKDESRENTGTGFKQLDMSFILPLKPYYLRNLEDGVNAEMASHLLKYVPEFEGVLLSWWDIRFPDPTRSAAIVWEFPDIHVKTIRGVVNSVGQDYYSLSVYGTWKAHVHEADIPRQYRKVAVKEGDELAFTVKELQIDQSTLSIVGSLTDISPSSQPALSGRETVDDVSPEEDASKKKKGKSKKKEKEDGAEKEAKSESKKRKREEAEEEEVEKPATKKHKKDKS